MFRLTRRRYIIQIYLCPTRVSLTLSFNNTKNHKNQECSIAIQGDLFIMEEKQVQDQESSCRKTKQVLSRKRSASPSSPPVSRAATTDASIVVSGNSLSTQSYDSSVSIPASTITSDGETGEVDATMILGACTRCHMYVMLQKQNPRCPRCNSNVLMNLFHG